MWNGFHIESQTLFNFFTFHIWHNRFHPSIHLPLYAVIDLYICTSCLIVAACVRVFIWANNTKSKSKHLCSRGEHPMIIILSRDDLDLNWYDLYQDIACLCVNFVFCEFLINLLGANIKLRIWQLTTSELLYCEF